MEVIYIMCVFCKIINKEIPSYKVYETEDVIAFLDINQATKGHCLVVPKKHVENMLKIDDETLQKLSIAQKEVALLLSKKLKTNNFNFMNNCGSIAGQSVMHIHFHVIPRYENDDFKMNIVEHEPNFDNLALLHELITK